MAMWIYWPKNYCWSKDKANCEGLYTIPIPHSPVNYPTTKSSEFVTAFSHNKVSNVDRKATECKAPWWISSTFKTRDTWNFAVSITCLKLPQEFGWYAYSSIDLGQKDIATDFTSVQMIKYPFHDLAAKNYKPTLENNYSFLYVEKKINYIQTSLTRSKNLLKNSKNKDKKLLEKQILGIESNILKYRDILKNIKSFNTLIYEPTVISINTVTNSIIAQVNALNKILKIPFIKPDIIEYSGKLDRPSYMKGDIARFWIEGKDLDGVPIPDGSKLAISEKELVLNISPNSFVVAPLSSDVASNGRWEYKLVINGNPGINSITLKIGNNIEQKINFAVN
jgi:hypothetical protein